jgi:hypothetical protein
MKKLLFTLSLITLNTFATDLIEKAISESNLDAFTTELENRKRTYVVPFTPNEQLKYLDLSREIVTRRRNQKECRAFSNNGVELESGQELSIAGQLQFGFGFCGITFVPAMILNEVNTNAHSYKNNILATGALLVWISSWWMLYNSYKEFMEKKKLRETNYNNALKIRQLLFDNLTIAVETIR